MGKNIHFTKEQKDFLLEMLSYKQPQEICDLFYKKFNRKTCVGTIINFKCRHNKDRKHYKKWEISDNQIKWLLNMLPYRDNVEAIELFKNKFGIELNQFVLRDIRYKNNVKRVYKQKIRDTRFRDKFKKPLYNENTDNRGRDYVRIDTRKYQTKSRFVWEQYYGRKIPKGLEVIHLDNDKSNYDINNLALVKKGTRIYALFKGIELCDKDIIKAVDLVKKLDKKMREV